ncbi:MAG TPA: glutamine-hydrolyzing carbamoyl-phosphate synthase small subunit [Polyangiaceae bacterium]|nr:glutamine-hydrolyzing carbamoyl-phosphate synthase small subunit [Polyangiaceae bacterium]
MTQKPGHLVLADGTVFPGCVFGADGVATGEVVFTTGMTGYQEVLTDPSYCGQIVTMTAPQIGNTGINTEDAESVTDRPQVAGFVVRDNSAVVSNWRSQETLDAYLARHGIVGISEIDTRKLTRHLRDRGSQNGVIGAGPLEALIERARTVPSMEGLDLVARVSPRERYAFSESLGAWPMPMQRAGSGERPKVVAMDFGAKRNIFRCLVDIGCDVTAVPANTSAAEILALSPDGVFLSNGPGDPAAVTYAIDTIKGLVGKKPIFGICLGHQLLSLALGARTYKLKFGHRGLNQPVKDLTTGRVEITTQNHGFVVDVDSLKGVAQTTHLHLNDGTSEGLEAPDLKAFSVQYHPEAAAGPHDSLYLFERFRNLMLSPR